MAHSESTARSQFCWHYYIVLHGHYYEILLMPLLLLIISDSLSCSLLHIIANIIAHYCIIITYYYIPIYMYYDKFIDMHHYVIIKLIYFIITSLLQIAKICNNDSLLPIITIMFSFITLLLPMRQRGLSVPHKPVRQLLPGLAI